MTSNFSNSILWVSYKLGFGGAYAGYNKTITISNDNPYIHTGSKLTYKALLAYVERIATKKTRLIATPDGIHKQYARDQDLGFELVRKFITQQIEFQLQGGLADISLKNLYDYNKLFKIQYMGNEI